MKLNLSLRRSWTFIILITVIVPAVILMLWFGYQLYTTQLNSALGLEEQSNKALSHQVKLEFDRLKSVLYNKSDSLVPLVNNEDQSGSLKEINRYLELIIKREPAVREIIILSKDSSVIAAIDPYIGLTSEQSLSTEQVQKFKTHWGFDSVSEPPEFSIPMFGRDYISSPEEHDGFLAFIIAVPVGDPVKAVLISTIDINRLWLRNKKKAHDAESLLTHNYLLDRRGVLIAPSENTNYKMGTLMTHLAITRNALVNDVWQLNQPYLGINKQYVFGTATTVPVLNWILISEVITSKITRPIWTKLVYFIIIISLALLLFIWFVLFLAKKTIQPIQAICYATHKIALGDYRVTLEPSGIQEIDSLVLDFNLMVKARKKAEEKLQLSDQVFRETHDGIIITNKDGTIIEVNPRFCEITGYEPEEVIGKNPHILNSGRQSRSFYVDMWKTIIKQGHWQGEIWNRHKNGSSYAELMTISNLKDDSNNILYYVGIFSDITQSKKQQEIFEQMAHYDQLTQLPNRVLLADRFIQALAQSKRQKSMLAVCFLDLDNFKPVNDLYGHEMGDQLLIEVAERIKTNIRDEDTVSRQGGDEFALLLGSIESFSQCEKMLQRIISSLAQPYIIEQQLISISASVGVTLYPIDGTDADTLMRHADQAMYQAKLTGRNRFHLFNAEQDQLSIKKTTQLKEIEQALVNNELCLYYQPKVNMKTGIVFGAEALIRWNHPEKGLIPPLKFLPIIDGTDLEIQIGNWVINEALRQLDSWKAQDIELEVSVNISSYHLQSPSFSSELEDALALHPKISSKYLQLEILESSALGDLHSIGAIIQRCINEFGVNVALDDFGTGYSSLTHLRNLAAKTIKIDQSFVKNVLDYPNDYAIIDGLIGLADTFNRDVIAEGVETTEHGLMLLLMGCTEAQGYGITRPMPAVDIPAWLNNYIANSEWMAYTNKVYTKKEIKIKLFRLTLMQWQKYFESSLNSPIDSNLKWPILKRTKCYCGIWLQREKKEQLFEESWLIRLKDAHNIMHDIADDLFEQYQGDEIEAARKELINLQIAIENMNRVLGQCE